VDKPVDLVLTSPPYPSTYDYVPLQHLRLVWFDEGARGTEIGARRAWRKGEAPARRQWSEDTLAWTRAAARAVNMGGHLVVVIGDGLTPKGVVDSSKVTEEAARVCGFRSVARASVGRVDFARDATRWEHAFVFEKADGTSRS
jgi:site-specific DNA-methyltransferase (cytosine-N4-specific)